MAAAYGWPGILQLLAYHQADLSLASQWSTTPLSIAVIKGNSSCVLYLLSCEQHLDVNTKNTQGRTLLHEICSNMSDTSLLYARELLRHKANVNVADVSGTSPLHLLMQTKPHKDLLSLVQLLLEAGADPNLANEQGQTPLMLAVDGRSHERVKLLLKHGAQIAGRDKGTGESILHHWLKLGTVMDLADYWHVIEGQPVRSLLVTAAKNGMVRSVGSENKAEYLFLLESRMCSSLRRFYFFFFTNPSRKGFAGCKKTLFPSSPF